MEFSFALDTILIFIFIIIPGIVFRRFYFRGEFTKQYNSRTIAHLFLASIIPGLIIQFLTLTVFSTISNLTEFITSSTEIFNQFINFDINEQLFESTWVFSLLIYIFLMFAISVLFAELCWKFVRLTRADRRSNILRFRNHWNYYLKGEIDGFEEYKKLTDGKSIFRVFADVLVRIENEEPRLYKGRVTQYNINNAHELKYLYLTKSRIYKKNKKGVRKAKKIPGHIMILSAADIININLSYVFIENIPSFQRYFSEVRRAINFVSLFCILLVIFYPFEYLDSESLLGRILLSAYIILFIILLAALVRNILNFNNPDRKSLIFGQSIILILLSIIYWAMKYVFHIF